MRDKITPTIAVQLLKDGNSRFVNNLKVNRNLLQQVNETSANQHPFAIILSCIDSRTSAELIFDQGLGDLFVIRVAGNVIAPSLLASIEFAASTFGTALCVVMGSMATVGFSEGLTNVASLGLAQRAHPCPSR